MTPEWLQKIQKTQEENGVYTQRDFQIDFSDEKAQAGLADFLRRYSHKPLEFFATSNDWQAMIPPVFQASIAEYGQIEELPAGLITPVTETSNHAKKRWIWKSQPVKDYLEGEPFDETYIEGATSIVRWRKPGAKIVESYEAAKDLPLDQMGANIRLTLNSFKEREWRHFIHTLHAGTSNEFDTNSTDKNGSPISELHGWRSFFDNAYESTDPYRDSTYASWYEIKEARSKMLRRERDAVRPNVLICNASTEAYLLDSMAINNAAFWGGSNTALQTGEIPPAYRLTYVIVPDAYFGYFEDDITRDNSEFVRTNDAFLLTTNNGPTIMKHIREPLSTESWNVYHKQQRAMSMWSRYEYSIFRYTNLMRIVKNHENLDGITTRLE